MLNKLITSLLIVLLTSTFCYAKDYWVYIQTSDRSGLTASDDAGRSKTGDIVSVIRAVDGEKPTETTQNEYLILTVSDLAEAEINELINPKEEEYVNFIENGNASIEERTVRKPKAFRTKRIDFVLAKIDEKVGWISKPIDHTKFMDYIRAKTSSEYSRYETKRKYFAYVQYPLKKLRDKIIPYAYAANDVQKICAVGANCTDENYNDLQTWESAHDGVLSVIEEADCYDDDGDIGEGAVTFDGSTTSSSAYMWVTAPVGERHTGIINTGATLTSEGTTITISDEYVKISWLEFDGTNNATSSRFILENGNFQMTIEHNLFHDYTACNTGAACGVNGRDGNISNNLFFNLGGSGERAITDNYSGAMYVANNTIYDVDVGFQHDGTNGGNIFAYNNWIDDNDADGDALGNCGGGSNNATDDATADDDADCSGGAVVNYAMSTRTVNLTGDFHLLSTATSVIDAGADLGTSYGANLDIDNFDRNGCTLTWDIGFDEYQTTCGRRMFLIQ